MSASLGGFLSWMLLAFFPMYSSCQGGDVEDAAERIPPPVELRAAVDRTTATTGEPIVYTVTLEHRPDIAVTLPDVFSAIKGLKVTDVKEKEYERDGRRVEEARYELKAFEVGSYVLPALEVTWTGSDGEEKKAGAAQIFVEIQSSLKEGEEEEDIEDIKAPVVPPYDWRPVARAGAGLLGLVALVYAVWRRLRRREGADAEPEPPPWEQALQALDALEKEPRDGDEAVRAWTFELSEVVRRYLEKRYHFPALEETTEEIVQAFREGRGPGGRARERVRHILQESDRIKFARGRATPGMLEDLLNAAREFVHATIPANPEDQGGAS